MSIHFRPHHGEKRVVNKKLSGTSGSGIAVTDPFLIMTHKRISHQGSIGIEFEMSTNVILNTEVEFLH